jgi:hypothetical protein
VAYKAGLISIQLARSGLAAPAHWRFETELDNIL